MKQVYRLSWAILLMLIQWTMIQNSLATTYYVSAANGDDSANGRSWATAKQSIQAAIELSQNGDTVIVTNGVYAPIVSDNKAITIRSVNGAEATIIDGHQSAGCAWLTFTDTSLGDGFDTRLVGFTLQNGKSSEFGGTYGGTIDRCIIRNNQGGYARGLGGGSRASKLYNCLVVSNIYNGVLHSKTLNCTIVDNGVWGCWDSHAYNCIVYGHMHSFGAMQEHRYSNCIIGDPGFVDCENGDYYLAQESRCVDVGENSVDIDNNGGYVSTIKDLADNPRIVGGNVDIGCYELQRDCSTGIPHSRVTTKTAKNATCTEDGWTREVRCSRCNKVLVASLGIPKLGHVEVETKAATVSCTEAGWTHEVKCSRCNAVLEESVQVPALGHVGTETKGAKTATCTEDGWTHEIGCSRCPAILEASTVLPRLGHVEVETRAAKAATCTEDGWTHEIGCSRCHAVLEASTALPKLGGDHVGVETKIAKTATCTEDGWTHEVTCSRCHSILEISTVLPELGHVEVETRLAKAATCTEPGWTHEVTCSRCNAIVEHSTNLAALGHVPQTTITAIEPTCTTDGRTAQVVCSRCGVTLETSTVLPAGHSGAVTKPAVEPTSGVAGKTAEITCTRCGTVLQAQETIPALGYIRNLLVAQLWPHRKIAVRYELASDIGDVASPNTSITVKGMYGSTTKTAAHLLGDASCTPGMHYIVWDVEGDSITFTQNSMTVSVAYSSATASKSCWVSLGSGLKDGMSINGDKKILFFSPFGNGEVQLLVDGNLFLSAAHQGSFSWTPQTTGSHTLVHKSGRYTWTRTLNVTSLAWATDPVPNPPTAEDPNISISSTSKSFAVGGGSGSIVTSGSGKWTATASDDWITIPSAMASRNAGLPVVYQVTTNSGVEPRTGYIYVSGHVFTVTQAGVGAALDSTSASFKTGGGTGSFTVLAGAQTSWQAKPNVDWISVAATTGTGESAVTYTVAPFNEVSTRSGTITAAGCTFTVNQTGRRMKIAGGTIVSSVSGLTADYDYQSHVIDIQVNALASTVWDIEPEASWISVVDAGSGRGGDNVALAINENPSYLARSGVVRIGTEMLTIHQAGRPASALSFSISPIASTASVKGANAIVSVTATPDLPWTATSQANWLTVMPTFHSGAGNGNVIYSASPNPTMSARSGTIKVSPEVGSSKRHTVSQPAATAMVSAMSHTFAATGESFPVEVTVDDVVNWTVSSSASWVVAQGNASRYGPGTVTVAASENLTVEPREGNLTIAGYTFHAVQRGRSVQVEYETRVFGTETDYATLDVHPDGNVTWTAVSSDPSWLTIWGGEGCSYDADGNVVGTGDNTIEYIVADYVGDGMPRTATITIGDKTVYITQRGYELSINPTGTRVSGNAGSGTVGVSASVGEVWNAIATEPWITITSGYSEGSGSGTVRFTYADNNTGEERTGKIVIAGEAYTVTQAARQMVTVSSRIEGGKGIVSGGGTYDRGTTITLTAIAQDGYEFLNWGLPNGSTATAASLTVTADVDKEIVANFRRIPYYGVNGESVREGTSVSFTAPADIVDAAGTTKLVCLGTSRFPDKGTSFTLVVTEDIEFEWDRWTTNYLVTVTQPSGGKIKKGSSQAPATSWVAAGTSLTLTAAPNSGKSLFRWSVTGSTIPVESSDASLTLRVDAPLTVSAVFGTFNDTLATAVDAPTLVFTTGGDADWTPVIDATAQTGYTSARSGAGGADTDTWLDTTVEGTGTFSFRWRVDCEKDDGGEATWDRLAVFTNGVEAARIDGTTAWQTVTLPISGKTTIRWSFYRDDWDDPAQSHSNAAWIDGVTFMEGL